MTHKAEISAVLVRLEQVLPAEVKLTLRKPAPTEDLAARAGAVGGAGQLPADLVALVTWHDGQEWNSPLSRKDNRRLLSVREILDEHSFFGDPMSDFLMPWSTSWIPVLTNDAGDFLVYETQGPLAGALLHYWHDDPSRSVAHPSLIHWAEGLLREYEADA